MRKFFSLHRSGSELPYRMSDRILDMAGMALVILQLLLFVFLQEWEKDRLFCLPESVVRQCPGADEPEAYGDTELLEVSFCPLAEPGVTDD